MTAIARRSLAPSLRRWLVLAVVLVGCRDRPPPTRSSDWQTETAEKAALVLLDPQGAATVVCLPVEGPARPLFAGPLQQILDFSWRQGALLAGLAPDSETPGASQLVLFLPQAQPRRLGRDVRSARFSPDGAALAYQRDTAGTPNTVVLDLTTGKATELAGLADPRWEADGIHLRGTLAQKGADGSARWLRARWDRQSEATVLVGPGSAQIPAPKGAAVAWSPDQPSAAPSSSCIVRLGPPGSGQVPHKVQGDFCKGAADDRSVRWSPDGQWLAFAHPGPVPGAQDPSKSFLDVVAIAGGRSQTLTNLHHRMGPTASEIAVAPNPVWLDWSPSQRFLAITDGAGDLRVYDFELQGIAALGKADRPQWSPGGSYLLSEGLGEGGAPHAFVLKGASPSSRIDLGPARDARWIPAQLCDGSVAASQPS